MKAGTGETTCLLDVARKDSVKASDQVPVEEKKGESPAPEPVIKAGKGEKSCLLDGGKCSAHVKERYDSWWMD